MAVTLSPKGTRGAEMPGFVKPLMKAGMGLSHLLFDMMGDRMKMQGQPLVSLTTTGAKSGKQRQALLGRFADTEHTGAWLVVGSNGARPGTRRGVTTSPPIPTGLGRRSTSTRPGCGRIRSMGVNIGRPGTGSCRWLPDTAPISKRPIDRSRSSG